MGIAAARMATAGVKRVTVEPGVRRLLDGVVGVRRMRRRDEVLGGGWGALWIIFGAGGFILEDRVRYIVIVRRWDVWLCQCMYDRCERVVVC